VSYFNPLHEELRKLLLWADLRREQGFHVGGRIAALTRRARALRRALQNARRPAADLRREPNELTAIRALRPHGPRRISRKLPPGEYADRVGGAFLGRAAGCTLGAPVEGWAPERMAALARHLGAAFPPTDYWPDADEPYRARYGKDLRQGYTRCKIRHVPVDDDMTYTVLGLLILEDFGPHFTTADVGRA